MILYMKPDRKTSFTAADGIPVLECEMSSNDDYHSRYPCDDLVILRILPDYDGGVLYPPAHYMFKGRHKGPRLVDGRRLGGVVVRNEP